jgi:hypothetical protein
MHPEVKQDKKGKCPKCGMDLVSSSTSMKKLAFLATAHCLTGCAIGEVLGMFIGTALGFSNLATIALAIFLAFVFGYSLTLIPLLRSSIKFGAALSIAFASDTFSITVMEIVDNAILLLIPGAIDAHVDTALFWGSLAVALAIAFLAAVPVNYYLISRGKGHAVAHSSH